MKEHIVRDLSYVFAEGYISQSGTVNKNFLADTLDTVGDGNAFQSVATPERHVTYSFYAVGYRHLGDSVEIGSIIGDYVRQLISPYYRADSYALDAASFEYIPSDDLQTVRQDDARYPRTIGERVVI